MTVSPMLDADQLESLAANFGGTLLLPSADAYEAVRRVHNGLIDRRPALIAGCAGTADVAAAVRFGRAAGLPISVRGGGHNVAGRAVAEGGVMIDLAPMKGIHVDTKARTVRVQGGVTWGGLNRETQLHGLATTGGVVASTGVAGLTLGGGLGWLMGKHGLALDNLVSVELVTAEGEISRASKDDAPDLFWAVRGGGGNFGVATSLAYRLHPVGPMVTAGLIVHPIGRARDLLRFYRDCTASLPDEHTIFATFTHAPDGSGTQVAALVSALPGIPAIVMANMLFAFAYTEMGRAVRVFAGGDARSSRVELALIGALIVIPIVFGYLWPVLPISGGYTMNMLQGWNWPFIGSVLSHGILPVLSLALVGLGGWFMGMRSLVSNIVTEDYVVYAELAGVERSRILRSYVMRNALVPQVTGLAMSLGAIFNGAIITEQVFGYPGVGTLLVSAVHAGDYSLVLGVTTVSILAVSAAVLLIDLAYPLLDPRVKVR